MAEREKRRATTFRTSKGTIVNVAAPTVYVSPAFLSTEDVTNPTELRETLREELQKYGIVKTFTHPEVNLNEVNTLVRGFDGNAYISVGPAGEFWKWDDKELTLEYTYPHVAIVSHEENWRMTCWAATVFGGDVYWGGRHWAPQDRACIVKRRAGAYKVIDLPETAEVYGLVPFYVGGQWWLYAATADNSDGRGKVYRSADGETWSLVFTAPLNIGLAGMAVVNSILYIGGLGGNIYHTNDGTTFLSFATGGTTECWFLAAFDGLLYFVRDKVDICTWNGAAVVELCSFRNFSGDVSITALSNRTLIAMLGQATKSAVSDNWAGYGEVWATHGYSRFPSGFRKILSLPFQFRGENALPTIAFGKVLFGSNFGRSYTTGMLYNREDTPVVEDYSSTLYAFDATRLLSPEAIPPSTFNLWEASAIGINSETHPIPVYGFKHTDIYFKSDTIGTLTILIDVRGNGTFETYDTVAITANVFTVYPMTAHPIYLKLRFSAAATVTARVVCS